mmetsp:Transcript_16544/g.39106  ORF Transcript_16544/g.39106 Transcript_16544/m.39106 type:complete len:375 (+) Transcript_16544:632-1756(+)
MMNGCRCHCRPQTCCCCSPRRRYTLLALPDCYACIAPESRKRVRRLCQVVAATCLVVVFLLWMAMKAQQGTVNRAPDTLYFYTTPHVCGMTVVVMTSTNDDSNTQKNDGETHSSTSAATTISPSAAPTSLLRTRQRHLTHLPNNIIHKSIARSRNSTTTNSTHAISYVQIQTFDSVEDAREQQQQQQQQTNDTDDDDNTFIGHCGDCGACSNAHDISIYDDTQDSLFETSKHCAVQALIWGRQTAGRCLERSVGFTPDCNDCWVQNIMCDVRRCLFACAWHGLFGSVNQELNVDDQHILNRCTLCDEKLCGPEFLRCAGANRRRSGIVSDIERNQDTEVCRSVDRDEWWRDEALQQVPWRTTTTTTTIPTPSGP